MSQQNQQPSSQALALRTHKTRPEPSTTLQVPELSPFTYDALDPNSIRTLVPDLTADPGGHTWLLETVDPEALDYEFEALSYVWGSQAESFPITLNGRLAHVHGNLFTALPYLAHRGDVTPVRPIWIDAICINQAKEEEKMAQIRLMNKIYRRASTVWAWFGVAEHQDRTPDAIQLFRTIADESLRAKHDKVPFTIDHLENRAGQSLCRDSALLSAVMHIFGNEWFRRIWVVQEAALAANLRFLCGEHEINQFVLEDVATNKSSRADIYGLYGHYYASGNSLDPTLFTQAQDLFYICSLVKHYWYGKDKTVILPQILMDTTDSMAGTKDCLQPEDRILGIMGIFDGSDLEDTSMDPHLPYRGIQDLYTRFTTLVLTGSDPNKKKWWEWLSLAFALRKMEGMPSWVPDFHHQSRSYTCWPCRSLMQSSELYQDDIKKKNAPRCGSEAGQLVLRGKILEDIVMVYPEIPEFPGNYNYWRSAQESDWITLLVNLAEWEHSIAHAVLAVDPIETDTRRDTESGERVPLEMYWRTLIGNGTHIRDRTVAIDWYHDFHTACQQLRGLAANYDVVVKVAGGLQFTDLGIPDAEIPTLLREDWWKATSADYLGSMYILSRRQLFQTKEGRFGFTIRGVMPGDRICALNGSPVPHVIRRVAGDNETEPELWKFVGDAYVHGLMKGEADEIDAEERDIVFV